MTSFLQRDRRYAAKFHTCPLFYKEVAATRLKRCKDGDICLKFKIYTGTYFEDVSIFSEAALYNKNDFHKQSLPKYYPNALLILMNYSSTYTVFSKLSISPNK
jgi:hypothetical protein